MKNKRIIAVVLLTATLLLLTACKRGEEGFLNDIPEGVEQKVWFDELFIVAYPSQLADKGDIYFSRTFIYGDPSSADPVIFMVSEEISSLKVTSNITDEPYEIKKLEPNDALLIAVELGDIPNVEIRFKDKSGHKHAYGIYKDAASGNAQYVLLEK